MRPLEPLASISPITRLLNSSPAAEVRAELSRLDALDLSGNEAAARSFARGALALREGALDVSHAALSEAAVDFERAGEVEASQLARCEAWIASIRRGPRAAYLEAIEALAAMASAPETSPRVFVVATHYRGTALRFSGDASGTQTALLAALTRSEPFLEERAQVLSSLGTLYVVLGAYGAAEALLEHAAELHHQHENAVGEALSYGQIGSAALGRGDLDRARRALQMQEWLASRAGDAFGQARALVWLADVALATGRYDDAILHADEAARVSGAAAPPLSMWLAYAARAKARAKTSLGDATCKDDLARAEALFAKLGHPLGGALVRWDRAHAMAEGALASPAEGREDAWFEPAWALASLGLSARVAELLVDQRRSAPSASAEGDAPIASEQVVAAAAQASPRLAIAQEVELIYTRPDELSAIASRRVASSQNLARLASLAVRRLGLFLAVVVARAIEAAPVLPSARAQAASIAQAGPVLVWAWPSSASVAEVARDLASLRAALGDDTRAVLVFEPSARIASAPFVGEVGVRVEGADLAALMARGLAASAGSFARSADLAWSREAEALVRLAGYVEG